MRTFSFMRNAAVGLVCKMLVLVLNFVVRTAFAYTLSVEYLGIDSLFANVLVILNLSDLGLSSVIVFALYKPLAEGDESRVKSLLHFYRNTYRILGFVFLGAGAALTPFLPYLLTGSTDLVNIYIVYALYLARTVSSYWFFAYKKALLTADQKEYVVTLINTGATLVMVAVQVALLVLLSDRPELSFYLYVSIGAVTTIAGNAMTAWYVDRNYPYTLDANAEKLNEAERNSILKNVYGGALHKVSSAINNSATSLIISSLIGVIFVGYYSNYAILLTGIMAILGAVFAPVVASVGNLNAIESVEKSELVFRSLHLACFWAYGLSCVAFLILANPFITIWLGGEWVLGMDVVVALTLKLAIDGLMGAVISYRQASGLYWNTRYRYVASVFVNIASALLFVHLGFGVAGAILGCCCGEVVALLVDPFVVCSEVFNRKPVFFYSMYAKSFVLLAATAAVLYLACVPLGGSGLIPFFLKLALCVIVPNVVWYAVYRSSVEFRYLSSLLMPLLHRFSKTRKDG